MILEMMSTLCAIELRMVTLARSLMITLKVNILKMVNLVAEVNKVIVDN